MQKIIPHLWFDKEAKTAANFYTSVFPNTTITKVTEIRGTPSGDCDIVDFNINGYAFQAISAGPYFKPTPSISFMVNFDPSFDSDAKMHLEEAWNKLIEGGVVRMPLDTYPFSKRYGWVEDKFGVNWQLMLTDPNGEPRPFIIPSLMFTNAICGKAEEATDFYISVFKNAKRGTVAQYPEGMDPDKEGTIMFTDYMLEGQWFAAMDSARSHDFAFTEGVSLIVMCDTQEEIDYFSEKLSAFPEAEQCGWIKDTYGVSWQIIPKQMGEMMTSTDTEAVDRVTKAMLAMKKLNILDLERAFKGEQ